MSVCYFLIISSCGKSTFNYIWVIYLHYLIYGNNFRIYLKIVKFLFIKNFTGRVSCLSTARWTPACICCGQEACFHNTSPQVNGKRHKRSVVSSANSGGNHHRRRVGAVEFLCRACLFASRGEVSSKNSNSGGL